MKDFKECILYEDKHFIVCHKPPGIPVQSAGVGVLDLECACLNYLNGKENGQARQPYVGIVHRLDQPVEGLLVMAKSKRAAKSLSAQVQDGKMGKEYLAVVQGKMEPAEGMLEDWLLKDNKKRMARVVPAGTKGAKEARLHYRVVESKGESSLVEIHLVTGRFHQIRVQFSHRGHPLAGDRKYNSQGSDSSEGIGLCAHRLSLIHPASNKGMSWEIWPEGRAFLGWHA